MTERRLRIVVVGPGRAGLSLALAAHRAGHSIEALLGREGTGAKAAKVNARALGMGDPLPPADLIVVAVRDADIGEVATALGPQSAPAVHLSGLSEVELLAPMGSEIGSFHPLQTLPTPQRGAEVLRGAYIAVTTSRPELRALLHGLAHSLDAHPFDLDPSAKAMYHAGASAVSNFVTAALALGADALGAAGVPFDVARPLTEAAVASAFELGPAAALTGPIARGDVSTVIAQRAALASVSADLEASFVEMARATARLAGTEAILEEALGGDRRDL